MQKLEAANFISKRGIVNENGDESFRGKRHAAFVSPPGIQR